MLQKSGPISFGDINNELRKERTSPLSLGSSEARYLAGVPSGPIKMSDFYGKGLVDVTYVGLANIRLDNKVGLNISDRKVYPYVIPSNTTVDNYVVNGNTCKFSGFGLSKEMANPIFPADGTFVNPGDTVNDGENINSYNMYAFYNCEGYNLTLDLNDTAGLGNIFLGEDFLGGVYEDNKRNFVLSNMKVNYTRAIPVERYIAETTTFDPEYEARPGDPKYLEPKRENYQFMGYALEREGTPLGNIDNPIKVIKSGTTLYAQWVHAVADINLVMDGMGYVMNETIKVPLVDKKGNPDISKTAKFSLSQIPMPIAYVGWEFIGFEVKDGTLTEDKSQLIVSYDKTTTIVVKFKKLDKVTK